LAQNARTRKARKRVEKVVKDRVFDILLDTLAVKKVRGKYFIVGRAEAASKIARLLERVLEKEKTDERS